MVKQNKNTTIERLETIMSHVGMAVMTMATMASMTELAHREGSHLTATLQPAYATNQITANDPGQNDDQFRRGGREEIRHTSATYGSAMRSHSVTGSL
jgi:hypothetical protein